MKQTPRHQPATHPASVVALNGELNIRSLRAAFELLNKAIPDAKGTLSVNLKNVESIDSAGLQLLLYGKAHCAQRNIDYQLVEMSEPVKAYLQRLNVATIDGAII